MGRQQRTRGKTQRSVLLVIAVFTDVLPRKLLAQVHYNSRINTYSNNTHHKIRSDQPTPQQSNYGNLMPAAT
jgi:hypothetical protein